MARSLGEWLRLEHPQLRVVFEREVDFDKPTFHVFHDRAQIAFIDISDNIDITRRCVVMDHGGDSHDAYVGNIRQPHPAAVWLVNHYIVEIVQAAPYLRLRPDRHLKHLLLLEEAPDGDACKINCSSPAHITRLDSMGLSPCQINLDLNLGFERLGVEAEPDQAVNSGDGLPDIFSDHVQNIDLRAIDANHDIVRCIGQRFCGSPGQVRLYAALEAGIALEAGLNCRDGHLIIGTSVDVDPELPGVRAYNLISGFRAAHLAGNAVDTGDRL